MTFDSVGNSFELFRNGVNSDDFSEPEGKRPMMMAAVLNIKMLCRDDTYLHPDISVLDDGWMDDWMMGGLLDDGWMDGRTVDIYLQPDISVLDVGWKHDWMMHGWVDDG